MAGLIEQFGLIVLLFYFGIVVIKELRLMKSELTEIKTETKTTRVEQMKTNEFIMHRIDCIESEMKELKDNMKRN